MSTRAWSNNPLTVFGRKLDIVAMDELCVFIMVQNLEQKQVYLSRVENATITTNAGYLSPGIEHKQYRSYGTE
jgi:hypothetical protein